MVSIHVMTTTDRPLRGTLSPNDAGWSSLVARRAHNPKVAGSNPAPATNENPGCAWVFPILGGPSGVPVDPVWLRPDLT